METSSIMMDLLNCGKKTIAFHVYNFSFRGTEKCLYDYADYNERILKNKSIIIFPKLKNEINNIDVILKFQNRFEMFFYNNFENLNSILRENTIL